MSKGKILQFFCKDAEKLNTESHMIQQFHFQVYTQKNGKAGTQTNVHTHIDSSMIHNSQEAEVTQAAIDGWRTNTMWSLRLPEARKGRRGVTAEQAQSFALLPKNKPNSQDS